MGINQEGVLKQQGYVLPVSSVEPYMPGMGLPLGTNWEVETNTHILSVNSGSNYY